MDGDGKAFYNFSKDLSFLDWRDPNIFRMAVAPIYNSFEDIARFHNLVINAFKNKNIAIVGGGLVGSLLSIYLKRHGANITVFDKRSDIRNEKSK